MYLFYTYVYIHILEIMYIALYYLSMMCCKQTNSVAANKNSRATHVGAGSNHLHFEGEMPATSAKTWLKNAPW